MSAPNDSPGFIPPHGGYDKLKSYQMSVLVYDATVKFCDRFIDPKSRTHDQMVQAARSGNKNISEGSQVSGTSKKIELKLVGVARASLEELLGDYKDFLRQRGLAEWGKNHPMSGVVRRLAYAPDRTYETYASHIENAPPEVAANTMLCLVHQTNYLLDQQLRQLEQAFLEQGGLPRPSAHTTPRARDRRAACKKDGFLILRKLRYARCVIPQARRAGNARFSRTCLLGQVGQARSFSILVLSQLACGPGKVCGSGSSNRPSAIARQSAGLSASSPHPVAAPTRFALGLAFFARHRGRSVGFVFHGFVVRHMGAQWWLHISQPVPARKLLALPVGFRL